ncbi:MAG: acyl carrier protein [Lewinellaceae bacterium]|nr:acyl carrier protein [Lewinellaceae bacterium]
MTKEEIITLLRENLLEIIPELEGEAFSNDESLVDLGANSIDRAELIMLTLEGLNLNVPRTEFVGYLNINSLAGRFLEKIEAGA